MTTLTKIQLQRFQAIEKQIEDLTALAKKLEKGNEKSDAADCIWTAVDSLLDALQSYAAEIGHDGFFTDEVGSYE